MHSVYFSPTLDAMTAPDPRDSLRERKRLATLAAIEDAATALVVEHGYDAVTVDEICARADVSKRTFFNYVPSKEAAVVGAPPQSVPAAERVDFLDAAAPDVPGALLRVFLGAFAAVRSGNDARAATLVHRRRAIFRDHPPLAAARMTATTRLHEELVDLVVELYRRHPALRRLPDAPPGAEARSAVALVAAAANLGVTSWLTRDAGTLADLDADCVTALARLARLAAGSAASPTGEPA